MSHNPAARIQTQHMELERLADRLRLMASAPEGVLPPHRLHWMIESEVGRLRAQILAHLDWEERYGYMQDVRCTHPEWAPEIEKLQRQHGELRQAVERVVDVAYEDVSAQELRRAAIALVDNLEAHERDETGFLERWFAANGPT